MQKKQWNKPSILSQVSTANANAIMKNSANGEFVGQVGVNFITFGPPS